MGCNCGKEIQKRMESLNRMRALAKKAAIMDNSIYVITEKNGKYNFARYEGQRDVVEYVHFL
ncbi:MAG: hypothetical protein PUB21_07915 [Bacteroidales bacterium]|nr:hypothetical protein [Bacteroidales bacterium]